MVNINNSGACDRSFECKKSLFFLSQNYLWPFLIFTFSAALTLAVLFDFDDWPLNHEYNTFAIRTLIVAQHFSFSDFFPLYSSVDNDNFGSPYLAFYHKLFYFLSAALFLLISNIKIVLTLTIGIFLIIGAFGMLALSEELRLNKTSAICAGIFLIVANYTIGNWLFRGAMAEFSAAMITPWVLCYFIRMMRQEEINCALAVSLALMFWAHSTLFFYLALLLLINFLLFFRQNFWQVIFNKSSGIAIGLFWLLSLPNIFAILLFNQEYDLSFMVSPYQPSQQFQPFWQYFFSFTRLDYGKTFRASPCQLDLSLILGIIISAAVIFSKKELRHFLQTDLALILPLFLILFFCAILQMPCSKVFYQKFFAAEFIQFPWRLLAIITPILIVLTLFLFEKAFATEQLKFALLLCMASMLLFCEAFLKLGYGSLPLSNSLANYHPVKFSIFGEYVPKKLVGSTVPINFSEIEKHNMTQGCKIITPQLFSEVREVKLDFECKKSTQITLPIFITKYHQTIISGSSASCKESKYVSGLCDVRLPQGQSEVKVILPNFHNFFKKN